MSKQAPPKSHLHWPWAAVTCGGLKRVAVEVRRSLGAGTAGGYGGGHGGHARRLGYAAYILLFAVLTNRFNACARDEAPGTCANPVGESTDDAKFNSGM
jgi:hypothetical protein